MRGRVVCVRLSSFGHCTWFLFTCIRGVNKTTHDEPARPEFSPAEQHVGAHRKLVRKLVRNLALHFDRYGNQSGTLLLDFDRHGKSLELVNGF